jgi:hypothetical protein
MKIKTVITSLLLTQLLTAQSDIAVTVGKNKFDDPVILKKSKEFIGLRAGFYNDENYGFRVGFERAVDANCQNLDLTRLYVDLLKKFYLTNELNIYGALTTGYEFSNIKRYKPNQLLLGGGAGLEYFITPQISAFAEYKVHNKQISDDQDTITTGGVAYYY